ncbi:hypothetical protein GPROT2_00442 [Gammaproteobacteria bacterium]|nr:hypothetical protein GPROT2_00442 [Gammaproteobacteria bacterium]
MKKTRTAAPKGRKSVTNRTTSPRSTPPRARHSAQPAKAATVAQQQAPARTTKAAQVLAALKQPDGTSLAELMQATGWQAHSVRGFLSGTVRKRLQLPLLTERTAEGQRYRIEEAAAGR